MDKTIMKVILRYSCQLKGFFCFLIYFMICSGFLCADPLYQTLLPNSTSITIQDTNITFVKTTKCPDKQNTEITFVQSKEYSVVDYDQYSVMMNITNMTMTRISYEGKTLFPQMEILTAKKWSVLLSKNEKIFFNNNECYPLQFVEILSQQPGRGPWIAQNGKWYNSQKDSIDKNQQEHPTQAEPGAR